MGDQDEIALYEISEHAKLREAGRAFAKVERLALIDRGGELTAVMQTGLFFKFELITRGA